MNSLETRRKLFADRSKDWHLELIHELFFRMAEKYKEHTFIISEKQQLTYREVLNTSKKIAKGLIELGLKPREHVALISPNCPEFILSRFGVGAAGGVTVPLNYRLRKEEIKYLLYQSDSSFVITIDHWNNINYVSMLRELCPEVFEGKQSESFPNLKNIIVFSPEGNKYPGTVDFKKMMESISLKEAEQTVVQVLESSSETIYDYTDIMYTSGTTSLPKGVLVSHDMIWRSALGACLNRGYEEGRRIFVPIPFYHCFGFIVGIIGATMAGGAVIIQQDFLEHKALEMIEKHNAVDILCVPTIALRLLEAYKNKKRDISSLRSMYCAGAEVPGQLWMDIKNVLGIEELNTGYGMTEIAAGVLQTDPTDDISYLMKYVGKVIPGGHVGLSELGGKNIEFKVKDIETGEILPFGKEGELICRGPMVTKAYYNKPEETLATIDQDGWLSTGDLAIIHENGYFSLTGRIKEIYRIGAENVAPKEIEDVFTNHDKINQAYVIGVPDPMMGEVGMAFLVLESGMSATEQEMIDYASNKLARFKIPKYIKFVKHEELPLTTSGKVKKFELKEWFFKESETISPQI